MYSVCDDRNEEDRLIVFNDHAVTYRLYYSRCTQQQDCAHAVSSTSNKAAKIEENHTILIWNIVVKVFASKLDNLLN